MRTINVSTDTFAAIWSRREPGEESEEAILRRLLGCRATGPPESTANELVADQGCGGVVDIRNGVTFPEGFRIFRHYKGREFAAEARQGSWLRQDDGRRFPTLNQLNASIAAGAENVWNGNWKYKDDQGRIRSIGVLRK